MRQIRLSAGHPQRYNLRRILPPYPGAKMPDRTWLDEYWEYFVANETDILNDWLLSAAALDKETE